MHQPGLYSSGLSYNMDSSVHINKRAISEVFCLNCQVLSYSSKKLVHDSYTADKHFLIYASKQILSQIVMILSKHTIQSKLIDNVCEFVHSYGS